MHGLFSRMPALLCGKNVHDSQLIWEVGPTGCIFEMTEEPNCEVQSAWTRGTRPLLAITELGTGTSLPCCAQSVSRKRTVLGKRNIGLQERRKYFERLSHVSLVSAQVCKQDLPMMDIVFRQLLRSTVGPLGEELDHTLARKNDSPTWCGVIVVVWCYCGGVVLLW